MRTCEKNKRTVWFSNVIGSREVVDEDENYTGEVETLYSEPTKTRINLADATSDIVTKIFGVSEALDSVTVCVGKPFNTSTKFYLEEPTDLEKYDYSVSQMKCSLNNTYYGLRAR